MHDNIETKWNTHVTVRGARTVTSVHSVPLLAATQPCILACKRSWRCRMSSCDRLSQASCTRCRNSAMDVSDSGESVSFCFIVSHTCSVSEKSGDLAGNGSCCTPRSGRCVTAAVCGRTLSCWRNHITFLLGINNLCNVAGTVYFTLQKHQMWLRVLTVHPHTMKPEMGPCVMGECSPEDDARQVYAVHAYVHHSHTDKNYSHHWRQQSAIPLSSRLSRHQTSLCLAVSWCKW